MLIMCVMVYFLLMVLLTVYTNYKEKNIFLVALDKDPTGMDPAVKWEVSSHLKRFDDMYTLTLAVKNPKNGKWRDLSMTKTVAHFFDENGVLVFDNLEKEVLKMHDSLAGDKKKN
jgi:signal peptidase complex subunit 2